MKTLAQHIKDNKISLITLDEKLLVNKNSKSGYVDWTNVKYGFYISFNCLKEQLAYSCRFTNHLYFYPYELEDVTVNDNSMYDGTLKGQYMSDDYFEDYIISKSEEFLYKIKEVERENRYSKILGGRQLKILLDTKNAPIIKFVEYFRKNKSVTIEEAFTLLNLKNSYKEIERELLNNDYGEKRFSDGEYEFDDVENLDKTLRRINEQTKE